MNTWNWVTGQLNSRVTLKPQFSYKNCVFAKANKTSCRVKAHLLFLGEKREEGGGKTGKKVEVM